MLHGTLYLMVLQTLHIMGPQHGDGDICGQPRDESGDCIDIEIGLDGHRQCEEREHQRQRTDRNVPTPYQQQDAARNKDALKHDCSERDDRTRA